MKREKSAIEMERELRELKKDREKRENRKAIIFGIISLLLIAGLSIFGYQKYLDWNKSTDGTTNVNATATTQNGNQANNNSSAPSSNSNNNSSSNSNNNSSSTAAKKQEKVFNYSPPTVTNGKKAGIIEVGASGFNAFAINTNGKNWEMKKKRFDKSFVADGLAQGKRIGQVLGDYISLLTEQDGVSGRNVHFVVSSGAQKEPETQPIINELKNQGYVVNTVTPAQEGTYAFQSLVPESFRKNSFAVDIGSGNTKISWMDDKGKIQAIETVGAKYYQKDVSDKDAYKRVLNTAAKVPSSRTKNCFIIGGVPYTLTKQHETKKGQRYVSLWDANDYKLEGAKSKSGGNIYKAIQAATDCEQVIFDADANFSIGLLNEIVSKQKGNRR